MIETETCKAVRIHTTEQKCAYVKALTHDIISKLVLSDVIEQGGEHRQQGDGCVVDVLGHTFHLL